MDLGDPGTPGDLSYQADPGGPGSPGHTWIFGIGVGGGAGRGVVDRVGWAGCAASVEPGSGVVEGRGVVLGSCVVLGIGVVVRGLGGLGVGQGLQGHSLAHEQGWVHEQGLAHGHRLRHGCGTGTVK